MANNSRAASTAVSTKPAPLRPWSTKIRAVRKRIEARSPATRGPTEAEAAIPNLRQGALHSLAWVSQQVAGLAPRGEVGMPPSDQLELVVEVDFSGHRCGRITVAFARGLTRQIGVNMAHMADLDGRPLGAVSAAKEMTRALATELLQTVFGVEPRFRFAEPQAMPPRPLTGETSLALGFAEGVLAMSVGIGRTLAQRGA